MPSEALSQYEPMIRLGAFLMGNQTFQASARQQSATLNGQTIPATNDLLATYPGADARTLAETVATLLALPARAAIDEIYIRRRDSAPF